MFTGNIIKCADCMIASGLIILFVNSPTACLPAAHHAGLFMKRTAENYCELSVIILYLKLALCGLLRYKAHMTATVLHFD